MWSVQTGILLDVLAGHAGHISSLTFSSTDSSVGSSSTSNVLLASGSWDKTVKIWDLFSRGSGSNCIDSLSHNSEILNIAFRPDGKELCAAALDGKLLQWSFSSSRISQSIVEIDGKKDISGGRLSGEVRTAANSTKSNHFTCIC